MLRLGLVFSLLRQWQGPAGWAKGVRKAGHMMSISYQVARIAMILEALTLHSLLFSSVVFRCPSHTGGWVLVLA